MGMLSWSTHVPCPSLRRSLASRLSANWRANRPHGAIVQENTLDAYIARLRRKLGSLPDVVPAGARTGTISAIMDGATSDICKLLNGKKVYVSDMVRTQQTAAPLAHALGTLLADQALRDRLREAGRQRAAARLTDGLRGLEGLRLPVVEDNCTHVYYVYPFVLDVATLGISKTRIADALRADGIEVAGEAVGQHLDVEIGGVDHHGFGGEQRGFLARFQGGNLKIRTGERKRPSLCQDGQK